MSEPVTKRIIVDLMPAIQAMNAQTLFSERQCCDTAVALEEMLKQCVDFLGESRPDHNYFLMKARYPHLVSSMIRGVSFDDRQLQEELSTAFLHLYVNVREFLNGQFGAAEYVNTQGGFDFYLESMLGTHSAILRQFNS